MTIIKLRSQSPEFTGFLHDRKPVESVSFNQGGQSVLPGVNIKEDSDNFQLELAAPGLKKDFFNLSVENNVLIISSQVPHEQVADERFIRREFTPASFKRSFQLSRLVDQDKISASYRDGILLVTLPKREEAKLKSSVKIDVI